MLSWSLGVVEASREVHPGLRQLTVRMPSGRAETAMQYTDELPAAAVGDQVLLNTTAVSLGLGTGGAHFVCAVLSPGEGRGLPPEGAYAGREPDAAAGHIMKLRYTPLQRAVLAVEEQNSPWHELFQEERTLAGQPVLIGELHSMLPIAALWLRHSAGQSGRKPPRLAYIMSDGAALPLAFSRHAFALKEAGLLAGTVTYGHAYGGDIEAVNKYTALLAAKYILKSDISLVTMGPGIVGTGTRLGFSGIETGELINAVSALEGTPVAIPRISFAEARGRHRGISHHLLTSLSKAALRPAELPLPRSLPEEQGRFVAEQAKRHRLRDLHRIVWMDKPGAAAIEQSLGSYSLKVTTMGRGVAEDQAFFLGAAAAAERALVLWSRNQSS